MDTNIPAQQNFNGGIIFLSYVIAVIGAFTTLELLQRRTHIRGYHNWFLLFAAAASMGGVGIWSMHFIGNNSLTITLANGVPHQLSYATGFTFASLIVAIMTMFLAFAFVGITEEATVTRIIPSGIIAGFGVVSMHYLGQVAVDFFVMKNKLAYVVSAAVIAVCAVTVALFIFFKLREKWANQWYKRLGCAMLMGVAVCGMHYTALVGTVYYPGNLSSGPPTPLLGTPALIGIIAGVVVAACIILFFIGAKNRLENNSCLFRRTSKSSHKRLILDTIFFDTNGRILVKIDGVVPMKEIFDQIPEDELSHGTFTTSHPIFTRLFETTIQWSRRSSRDSHSSNNNNQFPQDANLYSAVDTAFLTAANELVEELRFTSLSDLGHLFDSVLHTNTISKKSIFSKDPSKKKKTAIGRSASTTSSIQFLSTTSLFQKESNMSINESILPQNYKNSKGEQKSKSSKVPSARSHTENATVIDIFNSPMNETIANDCNLTVRDSDSEDRHIFLVKKIESNKDLVNLLSIGFRFAEPAFISKTMGEKLRVPSEYMLSYFKDMLQMAETSVAMYTPIKPSDDSYFISPAQQRQMKNDSVRGGVFVGLFTLIEDQEDGDMPYLIVEKQKRYTFPMVQLLMEGDTESEKKPVELSRSEKNTVLRLSGQTLAKIAAVPGSTTSCSSMEMQEQQFSPETSVHSGKNLLHFKAPYDEEEDDERCMYNNEFETEDMIGSDKYHDASTSRFTEALQNAASTLIRTSSYGKPLATSAKLYGDVIDIPAFSLRSGPCQLILFRAHITTSGTRFAINSTITETIKCIPFPLYRKYAFYVTDIAVEKYREENNQNNKVVSSYVTQQRLYQNTALRNAPMDDPLSQQDDNHNLNLVEEGSTALTPYKKVSPKKSDDIPLPEITQQQQQPFSSLSPPPRVKRNKFAFPTGITSLDINNITKDFLPNMLKGGSGINSQTPSPSASVEMPIILNLLPAKDRFWWLNSMFEETHNI